MCRDKDNTSTFLSSSLPSPLTTPPTSYAHVALGDSGTTTNLIRASTAQLLHNVHIHHDTLVSLPNGQSIQSTHAGDLLPVICGHSLPAYVFPDAELQHNLLSLSSITNIGCKITLSNIDILITLNDRAVYHGSKQPADTLWVIDLDKFQSGFMQQRHVSNLTLKLDTDAEFVNFVHATFGSPPASTFLHAARKGWLDHYPRLNASMIASNLPNSVATAMGHLDQTRQVKTSRRRLRPSLSLPPSSLAYSPADIDDNDADPLLTDAYIKVVLMSEIAHVDLTGRFPVKSRKGNEYVLVSVWDGYIHYEAMASRTSAAYIQAYTKIIAFYQSVGRQPKFWRLDNETSDDLEKFLAKAGVGRPQYVAPGTHRANKAERAIRHGKNHLQAMLASTAPSFPLDLWDECLPQAEITVNHLRPYSPNPDLCAYEGFHSHTYDFVAHPISIVGIHVLVHDKPSERPSWSPHGSKGFYLGPALQHHKCYRTWIIDTQAVRISDTLAWFPSPYKLPGSDPHAMVTAALDDLTVAMRMLAVSDKIQPTTRQLILDRTATATSELRAVVDLYLPTRPSDTTDASSSQLVADPNAQRVSVPPPSTPTAVPPAHPPTTAAPSTGTSVPSGPPSIPPPAPTDTTASPAPSSRGRRHVAFDTARAAGWSSTLGAPSTVRRLPRRGRPSRPPPTHAVVQRVSPPLPATSASSPTDQCIVSPAPSAPIIVPSAAPTPLPEVHPTRLGPPANPWSPNAPLLRRGQRTRKLSTKAAHNGHRKPNHRPPAVLPTAPTQMAYAADLVRASADRAWADSPTRSPPVCTALTRALANAQQFITTGAHISCDDPSLHEAHAALNLNPDGSPLTYRSALAGPNASHWRVAEGKEISKLIDTHTMRPIFASDQPVDRRKDTTYYNPQVKEKPGSENTVLRRVRGTIGGDRINYPFDVSARTADLDVVKILLNSVISTDAQWMTLDIVDYYLGTPLPRSEYLRIPRKFIPDDVMAQYNLEPFVSDGAILFEVLKGMYGLPQAGLLAQQRLIKHLATSGYHEDPFVPCLFKHVSNGVTFTLVVDDFGVKFHRRPSAEHLITCLEELYEVKVNWTGQKYLGLNIDLDRVGRSVTLSMPGYVRKVLERFAHRGAFGQAKSPQVYVPYQPRQGSPMLEVDLHPALSAAAILEVQEVVGSLLYYARAVDYTMLPAVNAIGSEMGFPTTRLNSAVDRLLAYAAAYPDNQLVFHASDMILEVQSDASYLSRSKARSVAGGLAYLGSGGSPSSPNGAVFAHCSVLDVVVASAGEAEYGAAFTLAQRAEWARTVLAALGHPQPSTKLYTDNRCAVGLANDTVKIRRSKTIDMRFHWVRDRVRQGHFSVHWTAGANILADFFTKAQPVHRHQHLMHQLVHVPVAAPNHFAAYKARRSNHHRSASLPGLSS